MSNAAEVLRAAPGTEQALGVLLMGSSTAGLFIPSAGVGSSPCSATHQLPDLEMSSSFPISLFTFKVGGW